MERVDVRGVQGTARLTHVLYRLGYTVMHTRGVERHHGTSRLRQQRKVRKTLAVAKALRSHRWRSGLAVGLDNVCRAHSSVKRKHEASVSHQSPAMAAKLADHIW